MTIVLDTNVLVSGIFWKGYPRKIMESIFSGDIVIVITLDILNEYQRVGKELSIKFPEINIDELIDLITIKSILTMPIKLNEKICEDPSDEKFIECALASNTKIIVSGDKHLLNVKNYQNIKIISPREFIEKYTL